MVDNRSPDPPTSTKSSADKDLAVTEWSASREVIAKLDDRITDLRKTGFTLVTALFAIGGLISKFVGTSGTILTPPVQFAIILVTLVLIVTLFLMDDMYRSEQRAAEFRARVLETRLNLELTVTTTYLYQRAKMGKVIKWVYAAFLIGATLLGCFVLSSLSSPTPVPTTTVTSSSSAVISQNTSNSLTSASSSNSSIVTTESPSPSSAISVTATTTIPSSITTVAVTTNPSSATTTGTTTTSTSIPPSSGSFNIGSAKIPLWPLMLVAGAVSIWLLWIIDTHFKQGKYAPDWTVDRVECFQGDPVRVTLTNMGEGDLNFETNAKAWKVETESSLDSKTITPIEVEFKTTGKITTWHTLDWLCDTKSMTPGIYRISVGSPDKKKGTFEITAKKAPGTEEYHVLSKKLIIPKKAAPDAKLINPEKD